MNSIFQVMGCTSDQYASMERYLVKKAEICRQNGIRFFVAYNNVPKCQEFIYDLGQQGASLFKLECKSIFDIRFYIEFSKIIKEYNIGTVHAYFAPTRHYAIVFSWLLGVQTRLRQAANLALVGHDKHKFKDKLYFFKQRILSRFATKYVCRSTAVKNEFLEMGLNPSKLIVADGGTDHEFYRGDRLLARGLIESISPKSLIIGTASRLVKDKGINVLIEAIDRLKEDHDLLCIIIGDGPEKESLLLLAQRLNLTHCIRFLGHKERVLEFYNLMDIYVSSSFSEGMSNSVLEALSCEVPVVLSDIEPNKEIVATAMDKGLYIGELFESGNPSDLAYKIRYVLEEKSKSEIGKNCRDLILQRYSLESRIRKEIEILR